MEPDVTAIAANPATAPAAAERAALVEAVKSWGYFSDSFKTQRHLLGGRRLLDIGMGGGPHSVAFMEVSGCASYVGVDPQVGTDHVRDFRSNADPSVPPYHAFPYSPADVMRLYPEIKLYGDILENVKQEVRRHKVDFGYMGAVTEHLQQLPEVFETIWETLEPGALLWYSHCGYHSWSGHHRYPREVKQYDPANPAHAFVADWKHLDPAHPDYSDGNYNRVRLADLRKLTEKYFEIVQWKPGLHATERLTPEIRRLHSKYTLEELLCQTLYVMGRRRDKPLDTDLSNIPFHHPGEDYLGGVDHSAADISPWRAYGSVYFGSPNTMHSHSDNDFAGDKVLASLQPGDSVRVRKHDSLLEFDVAAVKDNGGGRIALVFAQNAPEGTSPDNRSDWTIEAVRSWRRVAP